MNRQELWETCRTAGVSIVTHKLRSLLTTLGIVVGVGTVVAIVSIIHGLNMGMARQVESLGTDVIFVRRAEAHASGRGSAAAQKLTSEDGELILRACPHVASVSTFRRSLERVSAGDRRTGRVDVLGVTPDYAEVNKHHVDRGRFLADIDLDRRRRVCVLGRSIEKSLFPGRSAVGGHVLLSGRRFLVVGVLEEKGRFITEELDDIVLVPLSTFEKLKGAAGTVMINAMPVNTASQSLAVDEIRQLLRRQGRIRADGEEDFRIQTQASLMETYHRITGIGYWVIRIVASISLLVGGIGIMNIMLVSVTERTREIGIRKALGARSRDVLLQFLIEALALSVVGGIMGMGLGALAGVLVGVLSPLPVAVPVWALGLAFGVCSLVGLFFGVFPAGRAARLDPVEALRHE